MLFVFVLHVRVLWLWKLKSIYIPSLPKQTEFHVLRSKQRLWFVCTVKSNKTNENSISFIGFSNYKRWIVKLTDCMVKSYRWHYIPNVGLWLCTCLWQSNPSQFRCSSYKKYHFSLLHISLITYSLGSRLFVGKNKYAYFIACNKVITLKAT